MKFDFPVENGSYEVRLGFSEVYGLVTGQRVFNVLLEDQVVLAEHDIYAAVGANTADIEEFTTEVTDGVLTVQFEHVVENPKACRGIMVWNQSNSIVSNSDPLYSRSSHRLIVSRYIR